MSLHPISTNQRTSGIDLFQSVHRQANLAGLVERLLGRYEPLADFNNLGSVQSKGRTYLGLQTIPLQQVSGSVNRQGDFDRHFRPLRRHLRDRWVNIFMQMQTDGWEPVKLYKVWNSYYVVDGHHRVSVALTSGRQFIEAEVWEYGRQPSYFEVGIPATLPSVSVCCEECVSA